MRIFFKIQNYITYLAHGNNFCSVEAQLLNIQRYSVISTIQFNYLAPSEAYIQYYLIKGFPKGETEKFGNTLSILIPMNNLCQVNILKRLEVTI